jgi:hypothetical protein
MIRQDTPLHNFPFDEQQLQLKLRLPGSDDRSSPDYGRCFEAIAQLHLF